MQKYIITALQDISSSMLVSLLSQILPDNNHLVWLKDDTKDIIGFYPKWLCVQKGLVNDNYTIQQRINTDKVASIHYQTISSNLSLSQQLTAYCAQFNDSNQALENEANTGYQHGLIGYISYDKAAQITANIHWSKTNESYPHVFFGHYDIYLKKINQQWHLVSFLAANAVIDELIELLQGLQPKTKLTSLKQSKPKNFKLHQFGNTWDKKTYQHAFNQVQSYLLAGDCYQVNLAQRFIGQYSGDAVALLNDLDATTNAPYAGYIKVDDFEMISCSPELFIDFDVIQSQQSQKKQIKITTKPIKGTLPRLADVQADKSQIKKLQQSEKDKAENLMIVDLLRNDLSVYAKIGSVNVPELFKIESFAQVHHMVSTITAVLDENIKQSKQSEKITPFDVLLNALPGGSITGAPKIRATEIIQTLEQQPRGVYCGSLGYLNFDGSGSFNILIRTLQFLDNKVSLWAGGGITIASDVDKEYQECLDKIAGILAVLYGYLD